MVFLLTSLVTVSPVMVEAQKKVKSTMITAKTLSDFYGKFSGAFSKLSQGEIAAILQNYNNKTLISAGPDAFKELVTDNKGDSHKIMHEIFIYFGAFPPGKGKAQHGARWTLAHKFQKFVLKKKKKELDTKSVEAAIAADVTAMENLATYLSDKVNAKVITLPTVMIPALPKVKKK